MDPVEGHGFDGGPFGVVAALTMESSSLGGGGTRDEDDRKYQRQGVGVRVVAGIVLVGRNVKQI